MRLHSRNYQQEYCKLCLYNGSEWKKHESTPTNDDIPREHSSCNIDSHSVNIGYG